MKKSSLVFLAIFALVPVVGYVTAQHGAGAAPETEEKLQCDDNKTVIMDVQGIGLDSRSLTPVVILKVADGTKLLHIFIGQNEAGAIALEMQNQHPPRPLTHDLLKNVITQLGATVTNVTITKIEDSVFFAEILIERGEERLVIDARPSDSIALAIRLGAPIQCAIQVLDEAGIEEGQEQLPPEKKTPERRKETQEVI